MDYIKKLIGPDIKVLSGPMITIVLTTLLFVLVFNAGYASIKKRVDTLQASKNNERTLSAKLDILKSVEIGSLEKSNLLVKVLPDVNPATIAINQIRDQSQTNLSNINNFVLSNPSQFSDNINSANLSFNLSSASLLDAVSFLETLTKVAPIVNLDEADITIDNGQYADSKVKTLIYWSNYPDKIPPVTESVNDLTSKDNEMIKSMSSYLLPSYSSLSPNQPENRENPFY